MVVEKIIVGNGRGKISLKALMMAISLVCGIAQIFLDFLKVVVSLCTLNYFFKAQAKTQQTSMIIN